MLFINVFNFRKLIFSKKEKILIVLMGLIVKMVTVLVVM